VGSAVQAETADMEEVAEAACSPEIAEAMEGAAAMAAPEDLASEEMELAKLESVAAFIPRWN